VIDTTSGATARVISYELGVLNIDDATGPFRVGHVLAGVTSGADGTIVLVVPFSYDE
jgi:hypothetical protein